MKKILFILTCLLLFLSAPLSADSLFTAGVGLSFMPGMYDTNLLGLYDDQLNNGSIEQLDLSEIQPVSYYGLHISGQLNWKFLLARLSFLLQVPDRITYSYLDSGVSHTVEQKALFLNSTLWIGPRINITEKGSLYAAVGSSLLYGEWRDKVDVESSPVNSRDRQYAGFGFVFPLLLGLEIKGNDHWGAALEGVIFNQQIAIKTYSKVNFISVSSEHESVLFPSTGIMGLFPYAYWLQLSIMYHF